MRALIIVLLFVPQLACADSACPTRFTEFLAMFEQSIEVQTLNTRFPLRYSFINGNAEPEPKLIRVVIARANASKYPGIRYPSPAVQASVPLQRKLSSKVGGIQVVQFDKPESDVYSVVFSFSRKSSCWQLVEVKDSSL